MWVDSGTRAERTAVELVVSVYDLFKCERDMKELKKEEFALDPRTLAEYRKEHARVKKELARDTEHREILKKAAGILSQISPSGIR